MEGFCVFYTQEDNFKAPYLLQADVHSRVKTNGMTPLHYASFNSQSTRELVTLLIDKGADIEARTQEGWTPLHLAATVRPTVWTAPVNLAALLAFMILALTLCIFHYGSDWMSRCRA